MQPDRGGEGRKRTNNCMDMYIQWKSGDKVLYKVAEDQSQDIYLLKCVLVHEYTIITRTECAEDKSTNLCTYFQANRQLL